MKADVKTRYGFYFIRTLPGESYRSKIISSDKEKAVKDFLDLVLPSYKIGKIKLHRVTKFYSVFTCTVIQDKFKKSPIWIKVSDAFRYFN